jgi:hypothetical protein
VSRQTSCGPTQMTLRTGVLAHAAQGGSSAEALRERFVPPFLLFLSVSEICVQFNHVNSLSLIARAHQLVQEGYKYMFDEALATVWSAPNYCYRCRNMAAILTVRENGARSFTVYGPAEENERDVAQQRTRRAVRHSFVPMRVISRYSSRGFSRKREHYRILFRPDHHIDSPLYAQSIFSA